MNEICKPEECTGCAACANICGHDAITIEPNIYGYLYPVINQKICVDCGLCSNVCPNNTPPEFYEPISSYVGCAKNPVEQLSSTSGGIASIISRVIIHGGGVVFGCTGTNSYEIRHTKATSEAEIDQFKGSKYVQSQILNTFSDAKKELIAGKTVLFIGTPCQIAGLKSYIPQRLQERLFTIDFVCHGVPSQKIFNDALIGLGVSEDANIQFRVKEFVKSRFTHKRIIVTPENIHKCPFNSRFITRYGIFVNQRYSEVYSPFPKDDYIVGFLKGLFYRDSCYVCHYAKIKRISDITLGDYTYPADSRYKIKGYNRLLSKIIINTPKGESIIDDSRNEINIDNIDLTELIKKGGQLNHPMPFHPNRKLFLEEYVNKGFTTAVKIIQSEKKSIRRHILITNIRNFVYGIPLLSILIRRIKK